MVGTSGVQLLALAVLAFLACLGLLAAWMVDAHDAAERASDRGLRRELAEMVREEQRRNGY